MCHSETVYNLLFYCVAVCDYKGIPLMKIRKVKEWFEKARSTQMCPNAIEGKTAYGISYRTTEDHCIIELEYRQPLLNQVWLYTEE